MYSVRIRNPSLPAYLRLNFVLKKGTCEHGQGFNTNSTQLVFIYKKILGTQRPTPPKEINKG
jgi:hypothetical protein